MKIREASRIVMTLETAIAHGEWTVTGWGRSLLRNVASAMRIPVEDDAQRAMRDAMLDVHLWDLRAHLQDEIACGELHADILSAPVEDAPEVAPLRVAA